MCEYFEDKPLERLIAPGIEPKQINDDALGCCLDAINQLFITRVAQTLKVAKSVKCFIIFKINLKSYF